MYNKSHFAGFIPSNGEVSGLESCIVDDCECMGFSQYGAMQLVNYSLVATAIYLGSRILLFVRKIKLYGLPAVAL